MKNREIRKRFAKDKIVGRRQLKHSATTTKFYDEEDLLKPWVGT